MTDGAPIRIGYSSDFSGEQGPSGKAAWLAHQIWREDVNAAGGLLGRPVEFVHYDDGNDPAKVPGLYAKLIEQDKVDLLLGGYGNTNQSASLPVAAAARRLYVGVHGTAINAKLNYDRYFQLLPTGPDSRLAMTRGFLDIAATLDPKPRTLALLRGDDANQTMIMTGAREVAAEHGFEIVFDEVCPKDVPDAVPQMRKLAATQPDLVLFSIYPTDCVRLVEAAHSAGLKARMVGGKMTGVQLAAVKSRLGAKLNGIVSHDVYVPEPTMIFPGVEPLLDRYRARASAGTDPLGLYVPPFAYAQMQVVQQAVEAVGSLDQEALARHMHATTFKTVIGDVKFNAQGEWEKSRIIWVQYRNVTDDGGMQQFTQPGRHIILAPAEFKSGEIVTPFPA